MFRILFISLYIFSLEISAADCRTAGDTAHHMIPNASLKDLPEKLNGFIFTTNQDAAKKATAIKAAILIASNKTNYEWAKAKDKIAPIKASRELLDELPQKAPSNFNMFPMNLVHGPKAECRTDDVHLGNALDPLILEGPYSTSLCGKTLRDIGKAVLTFLRTSNYDNLSHLYEMVKKHSQVLYKFGRDAQGFSPKMWSYDPNLEKIEDSKTKRFRVESFLDDQRNALTNAQVGTRFTTTPSQCWLPIKGVDGNNKFDGEGDTFKDLLK
jgi:hypothetical protein